MRALLIVDRELQLTHDLAQLLQRLIGSAFLAQDHEIVGVGHDTTAEASLQPELLPSQDEPAQCKYSPAVVRWVSPAECRAGCPGLRSCAPSFLDHRFLLRGISQPHLDQMQHRVDQQSGALPTVIARHGPAPRGHPVELPSLTTP